MIKNIIFDFNGTILDDAWLCYDCEKVLIGNPPNIPDFTFDIYRDIFCHPIIAYYDILGLKDEIHHFDELNKKFFDLYQVRYKDEAKLFPGVKETLTYFKNKGYKLYILSATEINLLKEQLEFLGILHYFDDLIASNKKDAQGKKEYGKIFVKKYGLNKDNAILIGDTIHDFEAAEHLDVNVLLFDQGHNSKKQLEKSNSPIVSNYLEIRDYIEGLNK